MIVVIIWRKGDVRIALSISALSHINLPLRNTHHRVDPAKESHFDIKRSLARSVAAMRFKCIVNKSTNLWRNLIEDRDCNR